LGEAVIDGVVPHQQVIDTFFLVGIV